MACGVAGKLPRVHGDAAPGKSLHVRHRRVVVFLGAMGLLLFKNGEHTARRVVAFGAGTHRRATNQNAIAINIHRLLWDTHQRDHWTLWRELRIPPILAGFEWPGRFPRRSALRVERGPVHRVRRGEQCESNCNGG